MPETFDPYHRWLGISPKDQPPNHYRLLGIDRFEANPDAIEAAADQRMAQLKRFNAGEHSALAEKLLNEVAAARVCLLNPAKKAFYDRVLREQLGAQAGPAGDSFWQPARGRRSPPPRLAGRAVARKKKAKARGGALDRIRRGRCRAGSGRPDCSVDGAGRERRRRFRCVPTERRQPYGNRVLPG